MAVIRRNFLTGNTSVLLSAAGTTLTSADLAALPVVAAPDYAWLSLDPLEEHGLPEIVKVTAHSSSSVSATIERATQVAEGGGAAREHPSGTFWSHSATVLDFGDEGGSGGGFAAADAVIYVATSGDNADDGLTPATAKATIAGAYAALPSTGGKIQVLAGTFALGSAAVGLTVSATKPLTLEGLGPLLTTITYAGTGTGILYDGTGTDPNDGLRLRHFKLQTTAFTSQTAVKFVHVHRCYIEDVYLLGNSYSAGSRGLVGDNAYGNYVHDSVIAGFDVCVDLVDICHDFSINDTNLGGHSVCVRAKDSKDVRLHGGQHSGTGSTVGHMVITTVAGGEGSRGFEVLEVHYEGNGLDVAIGRTADGSDTNVLNPVLSGPFPSGLTLDRCTHPLVIGAIIGGGGLVRTFTLTANCSYPVVVGLTLSPAAVLSDASGTPTVISDVNGRIGIGTMSPAAPLHIESGDILLKNNQSYRFKDGSGTSRRIALMTGGNAIYYGAVDNATNSDLLLLAGGTGTLQMFVNAVQRFVIGAARVEVIASDLRVATLGKGLQVKEGSDAKQGVSTLVAGTVTVANTSVTATSRILLTVQSLGTVAAPKAIAVTARTAGASFTITSEDGTDTSIVAWQIFEPG